MKSPCGKVHITWLDLLISGKGPQVPRSNWKSPLVFVTVVVSALKESVHFVQSAMPNIALKATYPLLPWFHDIQLFLVLRDEAKYKSQNFTMKNTQTTDNQHTENTNVLTFACHHNRLWPVMTNLHNVVMQTLELIKLTRYNIGKTTTVKPPV